MALPTNALTTVAAVCGELSLSVPTPGSAEEVDLERRIGAASSAIERYCDRKFAKVVDFVERVPGFGSDVLFLTRVPLLSVAKVEYEGEEVTATEYEATPSDEDAEAGLLRRAYDAPGTWEWTALCSRGASGGKQAGAERRAYAVTYTAGYVLPKDDAPDNPRTLPFDVEQACILVVSAGVASKGRDTSVSSETVLSASVSYAAPGANLGVSGLPLEAERLLAPYRRVL